MSNIRTSLYFNDGKSNKEYHAEIVEAQDGFVVNFRYGRRGGTLATGSKTSTPVSFEQAVKIFDKLVKEKTSKGYTTDVSGATYQGTENAGRKTEFVPQLLNAIELDEAERLIRDPAFVAQEKMDGERRAVEVTCYGDVTGINRKGLSVALPQCIADELSVLGTHVGGFTVDGEIIGEKLHVFDLLYVENPAKFGILEIFKTPNTMTDVQFLHRMICASALLAGLKHVKSVPVVSSEHEKRRLFNGVASTNGEGVVFKLASSLIKPGRPNSGGDWLKFKFTERATVQVGCINTGKRSVGIDVFDVDGKAVHVGSVTIPPNYPVPAVNDLIEVEYLYAYKGGSLFQPVYHGQRTDVDVDACTLHQLKYKREAGEIELNAEGWRGCTVTGFWNDDEHANTAFEKYCVVCSDVDKTALEFENADRDDNVFFYFDVKENIVANHGDFTVTGYTLGAFHQRPM